MLGKISRLASAGRPEDERNVLAEILLHIALVVEIESCPCVIELFQQEVGALCFDVHECDGREVDAVKFAGAFQFDAQRI